MTAKTIKNLYCEGSTNQPGSLINAIGFLYDKKPLREKRTNVFFSTQAQTMGRWDICSQIYKDEAVVHYEQHIERGYEPIFFNLNDWQKDHVMMALQYNHLRSKMYMYPEREDEYLQQYNVSLQKDTKFSMPQLIATDQIFLPTWITSRRNTETPYYMMQEYGLNISPHAYVAKSLSEINLEVLQKALSADDYVFCPTGFFAIHERLSLGQKDNELHYFREIDQFKENAACFARKQFVSDQDYFSVYVQQGFKNTYVRSMPIKAAVEFLKQLEQEFIAPIFAKDEKLSRLDEYMNKYAGIDPAHHSHLTNERQSAIEAYSKMSLN